MYLLLHIRYFYMKAEMLLNTSSPHHLLCVF